MIVMGTWTHKVYRLPQVRLWFKKSAYLICLLSRTRSTNKARKKGK